MSIRDSVSHTKRVGGVEQYDFSRHLELNTLVDVQTHRTGLVILDDSFFNADRSVPMLLHSFYGSTKRLVPKRKLFFVVVDPVI